MVATEVGYKCPECAAPVGVRIGGVKPRQYAMAFVYGLGAGILGGLLMGELMQFVPFFPWLFAILFGAAVGEAARRGSGGHRVPVVAAAGVVGAVAGSFAGGFPMLSIVVAGVGAAMSVLSNRL